jgi:hypothetical protein
MPNQSSVDACKDAYMLSWRLGIKANALYRDGSKLSQPLASSVLGDDDVVDEVIEAPAAARAPIVAERIVERIIERQVQQGRKRLPERRKGYTQKAIVGGHKVYLRTGEYEGRRAGRGVHRHAQGRRRLPQPDEQLRDRDLDRPAVRRAARGVCRGLHLHPVRAERHGQGNDAIKMATSILDYVFRELAISYLGRTDLAHVQSSDVLPDSMGRGASEGVLADKHSSEIDAFKRFRQHRLCAQPHRLPRRPPRRGGGCGRRDDHRDGDGRQRRHGRAGIIGNGAVAMAAASHGSGAAAGVAVGNRPQQRRRGCSRSTLHSPRRWMTASSVFARRASRAMRAMPAASAAISPSSATARA